MEKFGKCVYKWDIYTIKHVKNYSNRSEILCEFANKIFNKNPCCVTSCVAKGERVRSGGDNKFICDMGGGEIRRRVYVMRLKKTKTMV